MEFLLSWLHDYVDLGGLFTLRRQADGTLDGFVSRNEAFQLGNELTEIGLAVEGYPIAMVGSQRLDQEQKIEVDVTSNRPDVMCHLGLARELAVALNVPLRRPEVPFYGSLSGDGKSGKVLLEDPRGCPRYVARRIRGVKVGPSPEWLRRRLEALGMRSINNVVDATNFVLWEMGQPLHAFDLAKVQSGEIRVRRARAGERLMTLDGVERELDPEILVIADPERAIGLAGIMGGLESEVTEATTDLLLESAHFDRRRIRIGAKRLGGLHTDASHRFERGADFGVCDEASRRCAALIVELAGGEVDDPAVDAVSQPEIGVDWELDAAALERFAGTAVGDDEVERILGGLGFTPERLAERRWRGTVPSWRSVDFEPRRNAAGERGKVAYPQDLYEEVMRHVGFDRIPATLPALGGIDEGANPGHDRRTRIRRALAGFGFAEAIHFAFQDEASDEGLPRLADGGAALRLANPLSERYAVMRRSLVPNLVDSAEFNARRDAAGVRLFELGHLFPGDGDREISAVALVAGGESESPWDRWPEIDLLNVKGAVEALLVELGASVPAVRPAELPGLSPGTGGEWIGASGEPLGWFGRIASADTPFPLFAAEMRLDRVPLGETRRAVVPPPRLPGISVDFTLTHSLAVTWSELARAIRGRPDDLRVSFRLKARYEGQGMPEGAVATTITFDYNGGDRTLTQEEVNDRQAALSSELERHFAVAREEKP